MIPKKEKPEGVFVNGWIPFFLHSGYDSIEYMHQW